MKPYASIEAQVERLRKAQAAFWGRRDKFHSGLVITLVFVGIFFLIDLPSLSNPAPEGYRQIWYAIPGVPFLIFAFLYFASPLSRSFGILRCTKCNNIFRLEDAWRCGHCRALHQPNVFDPVHPDPTFVEKCPKCERVPHSLWCPGCQRPMIFDTRLFGSSPEEFAYRHGDTPTKKERPVIRDTVREKLERDLR